MKLRHYITFCLLLILFFEAKATHNRAGEIYYKRIQPYTSVVGGQIVQVYNYSITIIVYTADGPQIADRCSLDSVYFGDGSVGRAPRINGSPGGGCQCTSVVGGIVPRCGEIIINSSNYRVKLNTYTLTHTYSGPGSYTISVADRNRNADVKNMFDSESQVFYIEARLVIGSYIGANSSPIFTYPPIDKGCVRKCFTHSPGAYDPDGDSLSFELTTSRVRGGATAPGYSYPNAGNGGIYQIDPVKGDLRWCNPQLQGEYNLAFIVREWRKNSNGNYQEVGYVLRDMQVIIESCNNDPPEINVPPDTCVEAGTFINRNIYISDPNIGDAITVQADGGAIKSDLPQASISNTFGVISATNPGFYTNFTWQTTCDHVRNLTYITTFKAKDNNTITPLATFKPYTIRVLPPSVKNVTATPSGVSIRISWELTTCNPSKNPIAGYKVYRKNDCTPFIFVPCLTTVLDTTGFELIATTATNTSFFIDDNKGLGLVVGQDYSYMIVSVYSDGLQSYGGTPVCARLKRSIPVITHVDVLTTSSTNGSIKINWTRPLKTPGNLDTTAFTGPYIFNLKHKNRNGAFEQIFSSTKNFLYLTDTTYTHTNVNTQDSIHDYLIEFLSGDVFVGNSQLASSVYLNAIPSDRRVDLSWQSKTPWTNYLYKIFRFNNSTSTFNQIGTTTLTTYADTSGLVNEQTYCYKVETSGEYSDKSFQRPLLNHSQEICVKTKDLTPPCTPTLVIDADCPEAYVKVTWNDVKSTCKRSDDLAFYELYYKTTVNEEYSKIATINQSAELSYVHQGTGLISGCYIIKATDINGNTSAFSPDFCVDNCPEFTLPNVFTPNGDAINEHFKAIIVRQIPEINMVVYDRWGNLVYKTKDPFFKWDGVSIISKQPVSEGTFFYICDVYEPRLTGISKRTLKGYVQVVR